MSHKKGSVDGGSMIGTFNNIHILGTAAAVPRRTVQNIDCNSYLSEKKVKNQIHFTGIETRHLADENITAELMGLNSAQNLINSLGVNKERICVLVFVTQTPEYMIPSAAFSIAGKLGLSRESAAFDINMGCSGYITGLFAAASILRGCERGSLALVIVSDTLSKYIDQKDPSSCLIFGDAGTATLLELSDSGSIQYLLTSKGESYSYITLRDKNS